MRGEAVTGFRIGAVHAFVLVGDDGEEGIPAMRVGDSMIPLVAADETRLRQLQPVAQSFADVLGTRVELVRFTIREHVEWIEPTTARCPGCPVTLPVDDLAAQREHMEREHPEIVAARQAESARWDGWEND